MEFKSATQDRIHQLIEERQRLEQQLAAEKKAFIDQKIGEGWQPFLYFSSYYGSHEEYGEGDEGVEYLFHPSVDLERWAQVGFSHGHHGQSDENEAFEAWLTGLEDDKFIVLGDADMEAISYGSHPWMELEKEG